MQKKAERIYQFLLGFIALGLLAIAIKAIYTGEFNLVLKGKFSSHYSKSNFHDSSAYLLASFCVLISVGVLIMLIRDNRNNGKKERMKQFQRILLWIGILGIILTIVFSR